MFRCFPAGREEYCAKLIPLSHVVTRLERYLRLANSRLASNRHTVRVFVFQQGQEFLKAQRWPFCRVNIP